MKRLLIVGAGGFGREVLTTLVQVIQTDEWKFGGFLDGNSKALDAFNFPFGVVGDPLTYQPGPDDLFACGLGGPAVKLRVCRSLKERGAKFISLFHPTARVGADCHVGAGSIFCAYSGATTNVKIGEFVVFNSFSGAGHDAVVGDGCTFNSFSEVTGYGVLEEGVYVGSHACILQRVRVGKYATIGAGSVAVKTVRAGTTVMGVPAKVIAGFDPPTDSGVAP